MPSPSVEKLKEYYENGPDNIGRDLIRPCLKECSLYRRGAAFFGSSTMATYADALLHVIKDGVKINNVFLKTLEKVCKSFLIIIKMTK